MKDDVLLAKAATIKRCIDRIHQVTEGDMDRIDEWDVQDIVILNLQRAIQAAIDMAAHVVAIKGLGLPRESRENFVMIQQSEGLDRDLSKRLQSMVGFRNIAIHDYQRMDIDILKSVVSNHLDDLLKWGSYCLNL
ncbi:protein of unknown function DUF86 [Dethiosulfovibrio peptidovorans DSM 11002]|uniref:DUF86 domain-containing protein n=1 Tax=Dethiosulfovibrio peptidovorans DSM 11002 TaxID=469381 RepID=D2Z7W1_9BACT|nr:DUF86 domain-containing protein [Dethiosulfovibrio peptidovorans]EFC91558.1 protein of unknown function DUF86 [Dethiosulfovibrio peptidovorans DSM 11002]